MMTIDLVDWSIVPRPGLLDYVNEDFTQYPTASSKDYSDPDNDFLIGRSGGFLPKMDFIFVNTDEFRKTALFFKRYRKYTNFKKGTLKYNKFWKEETRRRRFGLTRKCKLYRKDINEYFDKSTSKERKEELLHDLHITGSHYHYLNYSRILRSRDEDEKKEFTKRGQVNSIPKISDFPRFWDGDYWTYKTDQFAFINGFNMVKGKARRKGYSYKESSDSANIVNITPAISILHGAYKIDYLTEPGMLTDMTKNNLDWLELNTFWRRYYLKEQLDNIETGYKKKDSNIGYGFRSKLISAACERNDSALVGKDAYKIKIEESGKFLNLSNVIGVTLSTTETGATKTGNISMFGTGGTEGANWEAFERYFFNPQKIDALPLENIHTPGQRHKTCGFFHPQIMNYEPYIDKWGNSQLEEAFKVDYVDKINAEKVNTPREHVIYLGQRANTPDEAFSSSEASMFTTPGLIKHYEYVKRNEDEIFYVDGLHIREDGVVKFKTNAELKELGLRYGNYIDYYPHRDSDDVTGCTRLFHNPFRSNGIIPENLYVVTIDPVGIDKKKDEITHKHSLASITVKAVFNDEYSHSGLIMARFIGRRDTMAEVDAIALALCDAYNAKILPETDRGETVKNFEKWKRGDLILKEPNLVWAVDSKTKPSTKKGMTLGTGKRKLDGLTYINEMLYTTVGREDDGSPIKYYQTINDVRLLAELIRHNADGNFDSISDLSLQAYNDKRIQLMKNYKIGNNVKEEESFKDMYNRVSSNPFERRFN